MSRIFYRGKFYDYPIKLGNALSNLGIIEAIRVRALVPVGADPPAEGPTTLEGYIVSNYGWRLYRHFFKTYNEKVWGIPASELSADWGAQRIKGMSLWNAVWEPIRSSVVGSGGTSSEAGHQPHRRVPVPEVRTGDDVGAVRRAGGRHGRRDSGWRPRRRGGPRRRRRSGGGDRVPTVADTERLEASHVISSMPLTALARIVDPPVPDEVLQGPRTTSTTATS